jgi:uracil-DNA glycosylase family 4
MPDSLFQVRQDVIACRRCPRLVEYREQVARTRKREFREWDYWGKPVPGFGDSKARLLILGLAPAAHGGNRTGRVFTGDSSGDLLFRVLYETGFASQPHSVARDDGMRLRGAYITATVRCAPPANKPLPSESRHCREYLERETALLRNLKVVVALGRIAFDAYLLILHRQGKIPSRAPYRFAHGAVYRFEAPLPTLIASYHPSRQNTQTGRLTHSMFRQVFQQARSILK